MMRKHSLPVITLVRALGVLMLLFATPRAASATTWFVKAYTGNNGNGSEGRPFRTLQEVEAASHPGDTIVVLPSQQALDGGIQLKDSQTLIGLGAPVLIANPNSAHATLTNTSGARYDGDVVRLAKNNVVTNIQIDNAFRSSIFGINPDNASIVGNLMTNDMAAHDIFAIEGPVPSTCKLTGTPATTRTCVGEWPNGYIIYAPQTNHFGAITLVSCGPNARVEPRNDLLTQPLGYCEFLVPGSGSVTAPVDVTIVGNVIRDSNSDGIMLINDQGVTANLTVVGNTVRDLSQTLPDPAAVGISDHVVRSRGITTITIDHSVSNLTLTGFVGSNLSPFGNFAADGIVFLACGDSPLMNNYVAYVAISNPFLTGDVSNGDSIEIQHRGSTHGVLNVDIHHATLSDPASTNIKLIESSNPDFGVYNVTLSDSVLSNINGAGTEDAQIRYSGTERTETTAISLTVRRVKISGLGRGIGLSAGPTVNANKIASFHVLVEDSTLSDLTAEAVYWSQGTALLGTAGDQAIIDLGGGRLGSHGRNKFVHNGVPGYVPPGADPTTIDPHTFNGDVSVAYADPALPALDVHASTNYWGGAAPVVSTTTPGVATDVYLQGNVVFTSNDYLATDPHP